MWTIRQSIRTLVAFSRRDHSSGLARRSPQAATTDWLPPVVNPGDWSLGLMADRSAGWYFDRD